ncbi:hypothetical protein DB41_IB00900 [Neochlamydia sp. TUME1]|nr:hypothetical protein DB41_IB00900 [Neochlamydia sp. TUME1]
MPLLSLATRWSFLQSNSHLNQFAINPSVICFKTTFYTIIQLIKTSFLKESCHKGDSPFRLRRRRVFKRYNP